MDSKFKLVDRFSRPGFFVAKMWKLHFLDLIKPGACEDVDGFSDPTGCNSELTASPDGRFVYAAFDTTIWQLEVGTQQVRAIVQLPELPNWPEGGSAIWVRRRK